ncbi:MAG: heparinase II/III family protein [Bacteroidales bacterium]|nr:heparinase II/III family protein [Bacteroidales bacterium]
MKTHNPFIRVFLISCISIFFFATIDSVYAELTSKERNILAKKAKAIDLEKVLITDNSWNNLPTYKNREFWQGLPESIRKEYIEKAEEYLVYNWPVVKATDYLEFTRSGNRKQEVYAACSNALISLVMGELAEGKGRFTDQIINAVWYFSEQTWWGWSAHLYFQKPGPGLPDINEPTVDLGVGEITNNLSWTWYLFKDEFDKVHPLISQRLKQEIENKALNPYFERDDFGYMGFKGGRPNNWNPWVNYNMLYSYMIVETDPVKKRAEVLKIINSLDKFINGYSDDGGCDEGPSYWGAAGALLYENLEILKNATGGKFDVFDDPLIRNMGTYFYKVNIHAPYFLNFADADATTGGNASAVYRYGQAIKDNQMQQFGAYLAKLGNWGKHSLSGKICDQIRNLGLLNEIGSAEAKEALVADFWLPDTEVAGGRDKEGSFSGFYFGAKGGFNNESHNHNDVGTCILYYNGKPCLIDLGREEYNAKTFSSKRYEIWTMQSGYHNLPVINGIDQMQGENYKARNSAFTSNAKSIFFSTDIAGAYPKDALVKSWVRAYTLNRGRNFIITDKYELERINGSTSSNLMTYCKVTQTKPGLLKFEGDGFTLEMSYNPKVVTPEIQYIEVTDRSLRRYWPNGVTRVKLQFIKSQYKGGQTVTFTPTKQAS